MNEKTRGLDSCVSPWVPLLAEVVVFWLLGLDLCYCILWHPGDTIMASPLT